MRLAFFSPLPPARSGIARYSAALLPHLSRLATVDVFVEGAEPPEVETATGWPARPAADFSGPWNGRGYDICLYQMGNSVRYHSDIYRTLLRYPGVVVLHDLNLHSLIAELTMGTGNIGAYLREMAWAFGRDGLLWSQGALQGEHDYQIERYPLFQRVAQTGLGALTNSEHARAAVSHACPDLPIARVNLAALGPQAGDYASARKRLGIAPETLIVAAFGYVTTRKRIDATLDAFGRFRERFPTAQYWLVGQVVDPDLATKLEALGPDGAVKVTGYVEQEDYDQYLLATDLALNLRHPTLGETSATLMDLMAAGRPVAVSNVDAFAELPDRAVIKIAAGPDEADELLARMIELAENPELRQAIGRRAQEYARQECAPALIAGATIKFLEEVLAGL